MRKVAAAIPITTTDFFAQADFKGKGCSPFFLTCQMNLGELGEILGILFFYLYPEKEVESFITTHYWRVQPDSFHVCFSVLCNTAIHNTHVAVEKKRK